MMRQHDDSPGWLGALAGKFGRVVQVYAWAGTLTLAFGTALGLFTVAAGA